MRTQPDRPDKPDRSTRVGVVVLVLVGVVLALLVAVMSSFERSTDAALAGLAEMLAPTATPREAEASDETPVYGPCVVEIERTGDTFSVLQTAVFGSVSGDTLEIRGVCVGPTAIRTRLALVGVPTTEQPNPTLDGGSFGTVLALSNARVALLGLTVTNGKTPFRGGGVYLQGGWLSLDDSSSVTGNTAGWQGGGIYNLGGTVTLNHSSSVTGNTAGTEGGGIYNLDGTVILNHASSVTGNTAEGDGGGIYVEPEGSGPVYVCSDEVRISPNDPDDPPKVLQVCPDDPTA